MTRDYVSAARSVIPLVAAGVLATLAASSPAWAQDINTIAGTGAAGFAGDGGPAPAARLDQPGEIAVAPDGTIFFMDLVNLRIRRIRPSGIIDTVAGSGRFGSAGDGGPAIEADFQNIYGIAVDAATNALYLSDTDNHRVRRIDLVTGIISTFAGTGVIGFAGDGGPAVDAELAGPMGLAVDDIGNLFVVDHLACRVRRIAAATRIITTVAGVLPPPLCDDLLEFPGGLGTPLRVAVDRDTNLYVLSFRVGATPVVRRIDAATGTYTTVFEFPEDPTAASLAVRSDGHLFVASETRIFQVDPAGTEAAVVAGSLAYGFAGDGGPAVDAVFRAIAGLAFTPSGTLLVSDGGNHRIRAIGPPPGVWTGDLTVVGTNETTISLSGVTTITGSINISDNPGLAGSIDLGDLTVADNVTIASNTAAGSIDLGNLTFADNVTIASNTAAGSIDLGDLTVADNVTIASNTAAGSIDLGNLTAVGGDLTIEDNGACTNVAAGSVISVIGDIDVESCGTGSFTIGSAAAGGDTTISTTGYTSVTGTTAVGTTTVSNLTGDARMTVVIQSGTFVTPVNFALTRFEPLSLLPEIGLTPAGNDVMLDPVVAYEIAFEIPVLNRDAALTFDVYPAGLDAATRDAFLAALALGAATIATKSDDGSRYQTFSICSQFETPSAGGCVRIETLDENGQPTASAPAVVRFSNIVGHFSTWAVVISTASDATPPAVSPIITGTPGANGWYVGDVTITWDVQDSESPIGSTSGCDSTVVTSDTVGTSFTCTATSRGGTTSESVMVKRDKMPPTIGITSPAATTYLLNQAIAAQYACVDGGSGVASCVGPVATGANISTAIPGPNHFTVDVSDRAGNATQTTIDYQVQFQPAGTLCHGAPGHQILQPIQADGSSVFRQRSTVPAKFRVCDANGLSIGTPGVVSGFHLVTKIVGTVTTAINEDVISNTPDTAFRWDAGERQWIFNISNDNLQANATYVYRIVLNDGTSIEFRYGLR